MLKLYIVVNDTHLYQLKEQEPLILDEHELPIKLVAKNGFHFSKTRQITRHNADTILIGIGCKTDNGSLWGGIIFSTIFFAIFFVTRFYPLLLFANLPLAYLFYKFFLNPKEFITIEVLKK